MTDPDMPAVAQGPELEVVELGRLVRERRGDLSIRRTAAEIGVSFSTLSRVEAGHQPDLATFLRLCGWLGVEPNRFAFPAATRRESTIDEVARHLITDPRLETGAAERIVGVLRDMYDALARDVAGPAPLAVHLRATSFMRPGIPERLVSILRDMQSALEAGHPT